MPRRLAATDPALRQGAVRDAAEALRAGRLVALPTETVYGLGARASDPRAVARVYALKGRPSTHPLIVHLGRAEALPVWAATVPDTARALAAAFWPGPLTLVLPAGPGVPAAVTGGAPTVALRVPAHPLALAVLHALGPDEGVAAPSANRFGRVSPTRAEHVLDEFADDAELLVLDGGPCAVGLESTIVDLTGAAPRLLRPGGIGADALARVVGPLATDLGAPRPPVPGDQPRHYAPDVPARLVDAARLARAPADVGVLARRAAPVDRGAAAAPWEALPDDAAGYGRELYAALRRLERAAPRAIWIERAPDDEAWRAVRDRLERATSPEAAAARPGDAPTPLEETA